MSCFIVVDLGFGDCGKGTIVDALASRHMGESPIVVRHGGGPQAAHNVVTPGGRHHTFSQFGSGTFVSDCTTHLSKFMFVNPINMINEEKALRGVGITDAYDRLCIAESAKVITPFHVLANRVREQMRTGKHGTCGEGVGETVEDYMQNPAMAIPWRDLGDKVYLRKQLEHWRGVKAVHIKQWGGELPPEFEDFYLIDTIIELWQWMFKRVKMVPDWYPTVALEQHPVIFEGAQGVLLDEWRGFHPYTTWSTTTDGNARSLIGTSDVDVKSIGVIRTYQTRHGHGPFPTEDRQVRVPEKHNNGTGLQGRWRRGHLDLVLTKYAIDCCQQIDYLAITHIDAPSEQMAVEYESPAGSVAVGGLRPGPFKDLDHQERLTEWLSHVTPKYTARRGVSLIEAVLDVPVGIVSSGPTVGHKTFLNGL